MSWAARPASSSFGGAKAVVQRQLWKQVGQPLDRDFGHGGTATVAHAPGRQVTLRQAGLAKVRGDAQRRIYSLDPKPLDELQAWITTQKNIWARQLDALGAHLDKMAEEEGA